MKNSLNLSKRIHRINFVHIIGLYSFLMILIASVFVSCNELKAARNHETCLVSDISVCSEASECVVYCKNLNKICNARFPILGREMYAEGEGNNKLWMRYYPESCIEADSKPNILK